ncbi:MAG: phosphodiesterase [Victivallales bacterium]|jgi:putative phosphoesterase|nr:phosphodiesterase [Victivallales bacterium]
MKILFFSDVHGSPESVEQLMRRIAYHAPDHLALLGDVLYHGPRNPLRPDYAPIQVVERLNTLKGQISAVRGNCDSEVDQALLDFPIMSDYATLLSDNRRFFLTHGHLWNPGNLPPLESGSVLASGHTHIPQIERLSSGIVAFNPGSTSLPKGGFAPSYGWYENGVLQVLDLTTGKELFGMAL